jgi:hypothetical protein
MLPIRYAHRLKVHSYTEREQTKKDIHINGKKVKKIKDKYLYFR